MKRIILVLIIVLCTTFTYAQDFGFGKGKNLYKNAPADVLEKIQKADDLIAQKKYRSALTCLDLNGSDYELYKVTEIYTQYFIQSMMHKMFVVEDLKEDENILELRESFTNGKMIVMDLEELLTDALKKKGANPILNLALGNYYVDVSVRYGDATGKTIDELVELAEKNYKIAEKADCLDAYALLSLFAKAENEKKFTDAENYLKKANEYYSNAPVTWDYLSSFYYRQGRYEESLECSLKRIEYRKNIFDLGNDYCFLATVYRELGRLDDAIKALEEGKKISPQNPEPSFILAQAYYSAKKDSSLVEKEFLNSLKLQPTYIDDVMGLYYEMQPDSKKVVSFCKKAIKLHPKDLEYTGHTTFLLAQVYFFSGDKKSCKKELDNAKKIITKAGNFAGYEKIFNELYSQCE